MDLSLGDAVHHAKHGVDGIIHFQTFNCMPDVMLRSMLDNVAKEYNVPIVHYMRDEHASDVQYETRLEAFADILHKKYEKK